MKHQESKHSKGRKREKKKQKGVSNKCVKLGYTLRLLFGKIPIIQMELY